MGYARCVILFGADRSGRGAPTSEKNPRSGTPPALPASLGLFFFPAFPRVRTGGIGPDPQSAPYHHQVVSGRKRPHGKRRQEVVLAETSCESYQSPAPVPQKPACGHRSVLPTCGPEATCESSRGRRFAFFWTPRRWASTIGSRPSASRIGNGRCLFAGASTRAGKVSFRAATLCSTVTVNRDEQGP